MSNPDSMADRNLLFGILAVQMDFISSEALIAAMNAWVLDKDRSLGTILTAQGALAEDHLSLLEAMVSAHVKAHNRSAQQSLASISSASSIRKQLEEIADEDCHESLGHISTRDLPSEPRTIDYSRSQAHPSQKRYRILRPHARGGLGEVFVAEDQELHREVALKEIHDDKAADSSSRGRFILEAEITGGLEHPGIVPVYGLGQYDDGRPFYAMRFIKGDNLKEAITRFHQSGESSSRLGFRNVTFRELLGRFIDVCQAVGYAHSRGVLHRDLKPGNIMLGKYGETLLVDWGLAKPVDRPDSIADAGERTLRPTSDESSVAATQMGTAVGTPAFMSPEQAEGRLDQLGPATDIYSLGATLYSLLTGTVPFQGEIGEVLGQIKKGDFPPPGKRKPNVPAALEAICLRAMALKPEDRYTSTLQIAEDIEQWLADEPVKAYAEPLTKRLGRWVRKHKPLVAGITGALLVALVAVTVAVVWYREREMERVAEQAGLRQDIQHSLEKGELARAKLARELNRTGGVFRLLDQPAVWESNIKEAQGYLDQAKALLNHITIKLDSKTAARLDSLAGSIRSDTENRKMALDLEEVRMERYMLIAGELNHTNAITKYERLFRESGMFPDPGKERAVAQRIRASMIREQLTEAILDWMLSARSQNKYVLHRTLSELYREVSEDRLAQRLLQFRLQGTSAKERDELIRELEGLHFRNNSPHRLLRLGRLIQTIDPNRYEAWLREIQSHYPSSFYINYSLAIILAKRNSPEALEFCRAALAVRPNNSGAYWCFGYASSKRGRTKVAEEWYKKALEHDPKNLSLYHGISSSLRRQRKYLEALKWCDKALEIDPHSAPSHFQQGSCLRFMRDYRGAAQAYRRAIELDATYPHSYNALGIALTFLNDYEGAKAAYEKAIAVDADSALVHANHADVLWLTKEYDAAIAACKRALQIDPNHALAYCNMGFVRRDQGKMQEALQLIRKGHQLSANHLNWRHPSEKWVKDFEALAKKQDRLEKALKGEWKSNSYVDNLALAEFCRRYGGRYQEAVDFYTAAFARNPALLKDMARRYRYHAAHSALSAVLNSNPGDMLKRQKIAGLRQKALEWLKADLDFWQKRASVQNVQELLKISKDILSKWLSDPVLSLTRKSSFLEKLPPTESAEFMKLWSQVSTLLHNISSRFKITARVGSLTSASPKQSYVFQFQAGMDYVIDIETRLFTPVIAIEGVVSKTKKDQIIFPADSTKSYTVFVSSFLDRGEGDYTLRIREFNRGKTENPK